jgi:hypothetical protein
LRGEPVGELFVVEALGHMRAPFAGHRSDHRAGVELAAIDAHRAAEAASDVEGGLDDRVAREAWWHRFEKGDFPGRAAAGHTVTSSLGQARRSSILCGAEWSRVHGYRLSAAIFRRSCDPAHTEEERVLSTSMATPSRRPADADLATH